MSQWPEGWTRPSWTTDPDRTAVLPPTPDARTQHDGEDTTRRLAPARAPDGRHPAPSDRSGQYAPTLPPHRERLTRPILPPTAPPRGGRGRDGGRPGGARRPGRWRLALRWLVVLTVALLAYYLALGIWALARLPEVDALRDYSGRPADTRGETWLLVGSDSREGLTAEERRALSTGSTAGARTDTILLLHVPDAGQPTLVSLPRDSFLTVPAYTTRSGGTRAAHRDKLNAAYSLGGAPLLSRTVEQATGLRVDHYMEVGFGGVVDVVDAVGGVDMCVERELADPKAALNVRAGCQTLDGATTLGYVRTRATSSGDLGRIERQQRFLAALTQAAATPSALLNPIATTRLAAAGSSAVRVDESTGPFDLAGVASAMRRVSRGEGTTTTVPVADADVATSAGSAVVWDDGAAARLFESLRTGRQSRS